MGIRDELVELLKDFNKANDGREPTKIYLTKADEMALAGMTDNERGGKMPANTSVRTHFARLFNVETVWDAPVRKCE